MAAKIHRDGPVAIAEPANLALKETAAAPHTMQKYDRPPFPFLLVVEANAATDIDAIALDAVG